MRRVLTFLAVIASVVAWAVPSAAAEALYRGHGPGIRVEFRVKEGAITFARVRTVLKCVRDGRHARAKFGQSLGSTRLHGNRFRSSFETGEPGYSAEWLLEGGVHPGEITGRFWYQREYQRRATCQTKNYQSIGVRHVGRDSLRFWATRRPVYSRVRD